MLWFGVAVRSAAINAATRHLLWGSVAPECWTCSGGVVSSSSVAVEVVDVAVGVTVWAGASGEAAVAGGVISSSSVEWVGVAVEVVGVAVEWVGVAVGVVGAIVWTGVSAPAFVACANVAVWEVVLTREFAVGSRSGEQVPVESLGQ